MEELLRKRQEELSEIKFGSITMGDEFNQEIDSNKLNLNIESLQKEMEKALDEPIEIKNEVRYSLLFMGKEILLDVEGAMESYNPIIHFKGDICNKISFEYKEFEENKIFKFESELILCARVLEKEFKFSFTNEGYMFNEYSQYDERFEKMGIKRNILNSYIKFNNKECKSDLTQVLFTYEKQRIYLSKCVFSTDSISDFPDYCRQNNIEFY